MLTTTFEFEAAVITLVTLKLDCTLFRGAVRAGVTLQREAWRNKTEFIDSDFHFCLKGYNQSSLVFPNSQLLSAIVEILKSQIALHLKE